MSHTLEKQIALGAQQLLCHPSRWTRGALARTKSGRRCLPTSKAVASWCMIGAMCKAASELMPHADSAALYALAWRIIDESHIPSATILDTNDEGSFQQMHALLRSLIDGPHLPHGEAGMSHTLENTVVLGVGFHLSGRETCATAEC